MPKKKRYSREDISKMVVKILADKLGHEQNAIAEQSSLVDDLGADSLDLPEIIIELENKFGFDEIPDEEAAKMLTVADVIDYLAGRLPSKPAR